MVCTNHYVYPGLQLVSMDPRGEKKYNTSEACRLENNAVFFPFPFLADKLFFEVVLLE